MTPSARASALTDTAVLEIAKRIQRKRATLAGNPLLANATPSSYGQGFLRRLGLGKVDIALSPEITLAKMLKEWHGLDSHYASAAHYRGGGQTTEEKVFRAAKDLNDRIGLVEYRVFGTSPGEKYPEFSSLGGWLEWRILIIAAEMPRQGGGLNSSPSQLKTQNSHSNRPCSSDVGCRSNRCQPPNLAENRIL